MSGQTSQSPLRAPEYALHRHVIDANDTLPEQIKGRGIVMQDAQFANILVVPTAGADPAVSVLFWSEEAGEFAKPNPALDFAAKGAGVAWSAAVQAFGRRMFVAVTAGMAADEEVKVFVGDFKTSQV
jgi:hypothetical protein